MNWKEKIKFILWWAISIAITFFLIYWFVLWGGWKLFESGDPILLELGAAIVLGTIIFLVFKSMFVIGKQFSSEIEDLKKRIEGLENKGE